MSVESEPRTREVLSSFPTRVAVLDAGGQYVDLVQKAVERRGFPAEVMPLDTPIELLESLDAVVISGSPANSSGTEEVPMPDPRLWESTIPTLGICFGMQAMAKAFGGEVSKGVIREDGQVETVVNIDHPLFSGTKKEQVALFTHGDFVTKLPRGFEVIGEHELLDGTTAFSAIAKNNFVGVQFHPEVLDDTPAGYEIFGNFLERVARKEPDPAFVAQLSKELIARKRAYIREKLGTVSHVIAYLSGGVDSSVAARLVLDEIGPERFHAFYFDNGFMRDEDDEVIEALTHAGMPVEKIDATEFFEQSTVEIDGQTSPPLKDVVDPKIKRKIIGKAFIDLKKKLETDLGLEGAVLLQGTNAADRIESGHSRGDNNTAQIKEHHNMVKEARDLDDAGELLEPLNDLFKNEICAAGIELGLPEEGIWRHPFPGPGLAIRILGSEKEGYVYRNDLDSYVNQRVRDYWVPGNDLLRARVLPVNSVGVAGDERTYLPAVAIQGVIRHGTMARIAHELPAEMRGKINRVVYALGSSSLNYMFSTQTALGKEARDQLREADKIVHDEMRAAGLLRAIRQFPVVLLPISFTGPEKRSVVLRPVQTTTFMTVRAMLPDKDLPMDFFKTITHRILGEVAGISQVFLDLTNKPPGTTEWE